MTPSISLDDFEESFFFISFDLTTALNGNSQVIIPTVKAGHVRIEIEFNTGTFQELTLLSFCQYSSVVEIDKNRSISLSYLNASEKK